MYIAASFFFYFYFVCQLPNSSLENKSQYGGNWRRDDNTPAAAVSIFCPFFSTLLYRPADKHTNAPKLVLNFLPFCWVLLVFWCKHTHSRPLVIFSFFVAIKVEQDIQLVFCSVLFTFYSVLLSLVKFYVCAFQI